MPRVKLPEWLRNEFKKIVRDAMNEWTSECQYLTQDKGNGTYYCSKKDCEGVRFSDETD